MKKFWFLPLGILMGALLALSPVAITQSAYFMVINGTTCILGSTCTVSGGGGGVTSFNTRTGAVTLSAADVNGVGAITNSTTGNAATATNFATPITGLVYGNGASAPNAATAAQVSAILATQCETHTASSSATLDFTTLLAEGYANYSFYPTNLTLSASTQLIVEVSSDGGATWDTTAGHYQSILFYANTVPTANASASASYSGMSLVGTIGVAWVLSGGFITLTNTNSATGYITLTGQLYGSGNLLSIGDSYSNSAAINAVRFKPNSGNIASGTITGCPKLF